MHRQFSCFRFGAFLALFGVVSGSGPTVTIANGTIQGDICATTSVNFFLSIPYAKPPIGDLRFAAPQPYDNSYNGTLQATRPAPICIQFFVDLVDTEPQTEDW
jgi:carboxylesterase type B